MSKMAKWQHQQRNKKGSITQRLRTDLGQSIRVMTATQLVWLTWYTGPTLSLPTTANQKDERLNIL